MTVTPLPATLRVLPGVPPSAAWPGQGQAAIGMPGVGVLATHGDNQPMAIASVAKIMTAYVVLRDHPLQTGGTGPAITVTAADVAAYARDKSQGQSVVKVAVGEKLSELQALQAMLIPSGNNIAAILADWDAGSQTAFVAKMNADARALGLRDTSYADASGFDPATVSTASDQFRLTLRALQIPVFGQIVAMPQVTLPTAGLTYNVNDALGRDGIVGVKTGSSPQAGGCLVFSAIKSVADTQVTIVGVVLGVQATTAQPSELAGVISASENLLNSVSGDLEHVEVVRRARSSAGAQLMDHRVGSGRSLCGDSDRLAWHAGHGHGYATPPRPHHQQGPARRAGNRRGRQRRQPDPALRQQHRPAAVRPLAAHPALSLNPPPNSDDRVAGQWPGGRDLEDGRRRGFLAADLSAACPRF